MIQVDISPNLREYAQVVGEVRVNGRSVHEALQDLAATYPAIYRSICDETGSVRRHINIFLNTDMLAVRSDGWRSVPLDENDVLTVWQAVSGG